MKNQIKFLSALLIVVTMFSCQQDENTDVNIVSTKNTIDPEIKAQIENQTGSDENGEITRILIVDEMHESDTSPDVLVSFVGQPMIYSVAKDRTSLLELFRLSLNNKLPIEVSITIEDHSIKNARQTNNEKINQYRQMNEELLPEEFLPEELNDNRLETRSNDIVPNLTTAKKIFDEVNKMSVVYANGTFAPPSLSIPGYNLGRIPYQYADDGCYARAHAIRRVVENNFGYTSYKRFIISSNKVQMPLTVKATKWSNRGCCISWGYHVAVAVKVRQSDGSLVWYVIDPSIFSEPITASTWDNSMIGNSSTACKNMSAYNNQYKRYTIASQYYTPGGVVNNQQYFTFDNTYSNTYATMSNYRIKKSCGK
jgi:hypothetical protein